MKKPKPLKITLDELGRPDKIVTNSSKEFYAIIARSERGEFKVPILQVGATNGEWIFHLFHPQPQQARMFE